MTTTAMTASHRESSTPPKVAVAGVVVMVTMGVAEAVGTEAFGELI
jgi:hypothetical protein